MYIFSWKKRNEYWQWVWVDCGDCFRLRDQNIIDLIGFWNKIKNWELVQLKRGVGQITVIINEIYFVLKRIDMTGVATSLENLSSLSFIKALASLWFLWTSWLATFYLFIDYNNSIVIRCVLYIYIYIYIYQLASHSSASASASASE